MGGAANVETARQRHKSGRRERPVHLLGRAYRTMGVRPCSCRRSHEPAIDEDRHRLLVAAGCGRLAGSPRPVGQAAARP